MDRARSTACYLAMDGWSFSSLGSGVVALEGVDTEAPSAGAGGAEETGQLRWLELSFCNVVEEGWMETCPRSLERSLMLMLWLASIRRRQ